MVPPMMEKTGVPRHLDGFQPLHHVQAGLQQKARHAPDQLLSAGGTRELFIEERHISDNKFIPAHLLVNAVLDLDAQQSAGFGARRGVVMERQAARLAFADLADRLLAGGDHARVNGFLKGFRPGRGARDDRAVLDGILLHAQRPDIPGGNIAVVAGVVVAVMAFLLAEEIQVLVIGKV